MASQRSLLACVLLVVSGCALAIEGPDPQRPRTEVPKCDTGKGAVGMDGLMVAVFGIASLATFAAGEEGSGLAFGATSGLFLASGMRGNGAANECRAAYDEYNALMAQRQLLEEEPRPRPVVVKRPTKRPPKQPVAIEPAQPLVEDPQSRDVAAPYATPRPAVTPEPEPAATKRSPPARTPTAADQDDWSSFWKEAP